MGYSQNTDVLKILYKITVRFSLEGIYETLFRCLYETIFVFGPSFKDISIYNKNIPKAEKNPKLKIFLVLMTSDNSTKPVVVMVEE